MKRATLLLEDNLYHRAKALSQKQARTLKEVINDLLRLGLNMTTEKRDMKFEITPHKNNGPQPGVNIADREALYDLMDDVL